MMRGQAVRYAGWQMVDRVGPRLLASLVITVAFSWIQHAALSQQTSAPPDRMVLGMMASVHQTLAVFYVILFAHDLVSTDRMQGYYRFYLSKPVNPSWFYGQSVVLALAGMVLASVGYVLIGSWLIRPLWPWQVIQGSLVMFAIVGMMLFVFSLFSKHDWLYVVLVLLASSVSRNHWPAAESRFGKLLEAVLPPNQLIGSDVHPTTNQWLWIAGWGIGLFALGLVVLWKRPLGEG